VSALSRVSCQLSDEYCSLWDVQEAIDTINQTYEIDTTIEAWNYR